MIDGFDDEPPAHRISLLPFSEIGEGSGSDYLIKGWIERGTLAVIFGDPGCGKSFLMLDAALRIALGWECWGCRVRQGAVAYVAAEGQRGFARRIEAFRRQHMAEAAADAPFWLLPRAIDLAEPRQDFADLLAAIRRQVPGSGPALIVVDTLSRVIAGRDENSSEDMSGFIATMDRLRDATGAAIAIVHHQPKDAGRGPRGHSSLLGAVDTAIRVTRDEVSGTREATLVKSKDGEDGRTFAFRLEALEIGIDEDGDPVTSCTIEPAEAIHKRPKLTARQALALRKLADTIIDHGQPSPLSAVPAGKMVVELEQWRAALLDAGIIDKQGSNPRQLWGRLRDGLLTAGAIAIHGDLVWTV